VSFQAPSSPGLVRLSVTVSQRDVFCRAEALITVTDSLDAAVGSSVVNARGLPDYTFERAAGELWRSRFDAERNLIVPTQVDCPSCVARARKSTLQAADVFSICAGRRRI
jgi:hypothetical protein